MSPNIVAITYILLAIGMAFLVQPLNERSSVVIRAYLAWGVITAIIFLSEYNILVVILSAAALLVTGPAAAAHRVAFYIIVLGAVPAQLETELPFPGVNYLITLDHATVAALALLAGPLLKSMVDNSERDRMRLADWLVIFFAIYATVMTSRELPLTSVIRQLWINLTIIVLPYFAISRSLRTSSDIRGAVWASLALAGVVGCIQLAEQVKHWQFYNLLIPASIFTVSEYRFGLLRVGATLNGPLVGWVVMLAIVVLLSFRRMERVSLLRAMPLLILFAGSAAMTGSRAAFMIPTLGLGLYVVIIASGRFAQAGVFATGVAAGIAVYIYLSGDVDKLDEFGTFSYRQELIAASLRQISEYPFFGKVDYIRDENFRHLVQGQGIVDIVNYYLQIALGYGFFGLALFLSPFVLIGYRLWSRLAKKRGAGADDEMDQDRKLAVVGFIGIVGFLLLIGTTSATSYIAHFGVILLGITQAMARYFARQPKGERLQNHGRRAFGRMTPVAATRVDRKPGFRQVAKRQS